MFMVNWWAGWFIEDVEIGRSCLAADDREVKAGVVSENLGATWPRHPHLLLGAAIAKVNSLQVYPEVSSFSHEAVIDREDTGQ